jgi:hypothetical protein
MWVLVELVAKDADLPVTKFGHPVGFGPASHKFGISS